MPALIAAQSGSKLGQDKYRSFDKLKASEPATAWRKVPRPLGTAWAVIAPHAGGIERGTSEVAWAIAGHDVSLYLFEGLKAADNTDLHITSDRFDEPDGLAIAQSATSVLTVHGAKGDKPVVYIGGLDTAAGDNVRQRLQQAGFDVQEHLRMQGATSANICNRGTSGRGVQLELTMALRESFFADMTKEGRQNQTPRFRAFVAAVRAALGLKSA